MLDRPQFIIINYSNFIELQHTLQQKLKFGILFKILKSCFNQVRFLHDSVELQTVLLNESRSTFITHIITIFLNRQQT